MPDASDSSARPAEVLFGVGGGIAAAQVPALLTYLRAAGFEANYHVVLTESAEQLVTTAALWGSGADSVHTAADLFESRTGVAHIELARRADIVVVHPATADLIAKIAQGMANDLLTTVLLATDAPILVAPAMNQAMWSKAAVRRNVERLRDDGIHVIEPETAIEVHDATFGSVAVSLKVLLEEIRGTLQQAAS